MEIDEIEFANLKNHPSLLALKALVMGHEVTLEGRKIRLAERIGGGYSPVIISTISDGKGNTRPYVLGMDDMPLSYFLRQCEKLPEEYLATLAANVTLTEIVKEKRT